MYIFELLAQIFKKKEKIKNIYTPPDNYNFIDENPQDCEHFFMPLDSTNQMFACKHCGLVISAEKLNSKKKS